MKKRNPFFVAIISLLTGGIYLLYWIYKTKEYLETMGSRIPSLWFLVSPFIIALLFAGLAILLQPDLVTSDSSRASGISRALLISAFIIATVVQLIVAAYFLFMYSRAVEHASKGQITFRYCYWLGIVCIFFIGVDFLWPSLLQNKFNKYLV